MKCQPIMARIANNYVQNSEGTDTNTNKNKNKYSKRYNLKFRNTDTSDENKKNWIA